MWKHPQLAPNLIAKHHLQDWHSGLWQKASCPPPRRASSPLMAVQSTTSCSSPSTAMPAGPDKTSLQRGLTSATRLALTYTTRSWRCHGVRVSGKTVDIVADIYQESTCQVRVEEGPANLIPCHRGVKQGCPLSPILFDFAIDGKLQGLAASYVYTLATPLTTSVSQAWHTQTTYVSPQVTCVQTRDCRHASHHRSVRLVGWTLLQRGQMRSTHNSEQWSKEVRG